MKMGVEPTLINGGLGGAYYFRNEKGHSVAIVKPTDEEPFAPNNPKGFIGKALGQPGLKSSVRVGETGYREVAAYLLDYDHFANVPPTALVKITHSVFNVNDGVNGNKSREKKKLVSSKIASFQKFVPHDFDASDHGNSRFPVASVHRIGILDIRILNTDRHGGNLLVKKLDDGDVGKFGQVELIPIDHGLCLPETLEDPYFEWIHWPQASIPFSEEELEYIQSLDPEKDCEMLRRELPMIREACLRVLVLCTIFLKEAAGFGLCLAEIGEMMTREFRAGEEEPSELERACIKAKRLAAEQDVWSPKSDLGETKIQFDLDYSDLDLVYDSDASLAINPFSNRRSSLGKLNECITEEEEEEKEEGNEEEARRVLSLSKLSTSLNTNSLSANMGSKYRNSSRDKTEETLLSHKSANVQLPVSANFVRLAEMNGVDWVEFLDKFQELLASAFTERNTMTLKNRQRLGTSC